MKIGKKIKRVRLQQGLTQEELANRCELTKGFISQIENDLTSPSIQTLVDILTALGTKLHHFFTDNYEQVVFSKKDMFTKTNTERKSTIHWLIPNAQKNVMEPILVNLDKGGSTIHYDPMEVEYFGYVFEGEIVIFTSDHQYVVKEQCSFYLINPSRHFIFARKPSKFIWICTPPKF